MAGWRCRRGQHRERNSVLFEPAGPVADFEAAFRWPHAADLIRRNKQEFRDPVECVDFLLGKEKAKQLSREELIEVTRKLIFADVRGEVETSRLCSLFEANVPHPDKTDLIFYPKIEFKTPEELVNLCSHL